MDRWTIEGPQNVDLGAVRVVHLRLVEGEVNITATESAARLEVHEVAGEPLVMTLDDGVLHLSYPEVTWGGLLSMKWRRERRAGLSLAVPAGCPVQLGVVSAAAVVSGMTAGVEVRTVSGVITLDGISGAITAESVSGQIEALALAGDLQFKTVSGSLTVVGGSTSNVRAKSVSGDLTLDLSLDDSGALRADTVSGDVVLRLPDSVATTVDVTSVSGALTTGFSGLSPSGRPGRNELRGELGSGSGSVRVRTVSGDVSLLPRAS